MARILTGRNGSLELKRAPNGWRHSAMKCCVLAHFLDAADRPMISQVMSSAKMLATYPVPFAQERNASVTISRLELMADFILPAEHRSSDQEASVRPESKGSPAPGSWSATCPSRARSGGDPRAIVVTHGPATAALTCRWQSQGATPRRCKQRVSPGNR